MQAKSFLEKISFGPLPQGFLARLDGKLEIIIHSDSHKYVPIESLPVTIFFKPPDDLV
jgi:hypothetical protein